MSSVPKGATRSVGQFEKLAKVGEGTYGSVYKARDRETGGLVALKRVKLGGSGFDREGMPLTSLREIALLRRLRHPNVVRLHEVAVGSKLDSVFLVFEYCEHELGRLLDAMPTPFAPSEVKCLMRQLCAVVAHLHANCVLHRDLKLSNLLLTRAGSLKLCDFGLARAAAPRNAALTPEVVTLWYRAPELLLGATTYGAPVDCWALGCMFGELLLHRPLMPGTSELRQLELMCALLGTPSAAIWPEFPALPLTPKVQLPAQPYNELPSRLAKARPTGAALDLVGALLTYDPARRCTADGALAHGYFAEPPAAVVPDMCRAAPSSAKESEPARSSVLAPESGAENRCAALLPTAAPARKRPREARLPSPASVAAEEPRKL